VVNPRAPPLASHSHSRWPGTGGVRAARRLQNAVHPGISPQQGMEIRVPQAYTRTMTSGQSSDDFFVFPRVNRTDEVLQDIQRLKRLLPALSPAQQQALEDLFRTASKAARHAFRVQHLNSFEFFLLTALIEVDMRLHALEKRGWVHPPFP
jgi:hypothetical protein